MPIPKDPIKYQDKIIKLKEKELEKPLPLEEL